MVFNEFVGSNVVIGAMLRSFSRPALPVRGSQLERYHAK
jgi:hypothetical protein